MNVNLIKLKGVLIELRGIKSALERIAECYELELAQNDIFVKPPKADISGPPPTMEYTDEEMDWLKESGLLKDKEE